MGNRTGGGARRGRLARDRAADRDAGPIAVLVLPLQARSVRRDVRPGLDRHPREQTVIGVAAGRPASGAEGHRALLLRLGALGPGALSADEPARDPRLRAVA